MDARVRGTYERIDAWLRSQGDARRRSGPVDGRAVEDVVGAPLPKDLAAFWELEIDDGPWLPPAGGFSMGTTESLLETREVWLAVAGDEPDDPDRFGPGLVPIAMNGGGDGLVVDVRRGDSRGAVFLWDHESWGLRVPLWGGVAEMLDDVALALETGGPALMWHAENGGTESPCIAVSGAVDWVAVSEGTGP